MTDIDSVGNVFYSRISSVVFWRPLGSDLCKHAGSHSVTTEGCTWLARVCVVWGSRGSFKLIAQCHPYITQQSLFRGIVKFNIVYTWWCALSHLKYGFNLKKKCPISAYQWMSLYWLPVWNINRSHKGCKTYQHFILMNMNIKLPVSHQTISCQQSLWCVKVTQLRDLQSFSNLNENMLTSGVSHVTNFHRKYFTLPVITAKTAVVKLCRLNHSFVWTKGSHGNDTCLMRVIPWSLTDVWF